MIIKNKSRLVMIGDSITDVGRQRPVGKPFKEGLGTGYVNLVNALLLTSYPESEICVLNTGCSGNKVIDLAERWESDVLELKPDWLSIMIGINDVWRQLDCPLDLENHVLIDRYEKVMDELITTTKPNLSGGLILMTPYYIEPNKDDKMRSVMDQYGKVVKSLADKHGAVFVDVQAAFDKALDYHHSTFIAWDRVHPATHGHMIIAKAFLDAIEFNFNNLDER
ncbi:MAG: SGNH/GDSL hydrolase family protein [Planctomycetota bacterium]|jgi:lysophospholipase L1-like esterase